ncbi:MAG: DUF547 domain-containing protein [bacterium]
MQIKEGLVKTAPILIVFTGIACAWLFLPSWVNAQPNTGSLSYENYADTLQTFVDDDGMVNYEGLKASPASLDSFLRTLESVDPATVQQCTDKEKIALWVNAYNGFTLKAIIDHYPIQSRWGASLLYPKNSIRQIKGVWDKLQFVVMGQKTTLDSIEHNILRKDFNEPRIHMALVCAAMSCPPLRNEPFLAERLDGQFEDQVHRFLANSTKFRIDREENRVYLSAIFKWFGEDFVKTYGTGENFSGQGNTERAVLHFIADRVNEQDREYLETGEYSVKYLDYDWSLNEQQ